MSLRAFLPRRQLTRDLVLVTALGLLARAAAAAIVDWPPYTDPAYYWLVAERLATGHGFSVPVLWSFLEVGSRIPADPGLPVASNGHWMPLTSIVSAGAMAVLGPSWRAGQIPMMLLSAALVPATYAIGRWLWSSRWVAWIGALLATFAGPLLIMYPTVDNFAVFGCAGVASLAAATRSVTAVRPGRWIVASGALAGLATLARIDGAMLALAPATAWVLTAPRQRSAGLATHLLAGVGSAAAFLAVLAPWLARNVATYGTPLPSTGGHTLWISTYNEQFSIGHAVTPETYLASGLASIVGSKLFAVAELVARLGALMGGVFLLFFVVGSIAERRRRSLAPFLVYFWGSFAIMALVFTFHAPKGAFYHSAPAWLPFALPLSVAAIPHFGSWAGRAWPFLRRERTHRFLAVAGLVGGLVLSVVGSALLYAQWRESRQHDEAAAGFFASRGLSGDVVLAGDPASLYYFSHNPGVAPPFDPYPVIEEVARAYGARWAYVALRPGAEIDPLGLWLGSRANDSQGNRATFLADQPAFEAPGVRIYEVVPGGGG